MMGRTKESWRRFEASKPGHRFQERYRRRQEREHGWRDPGKLFYLVGGLIIAVGSLLLGVLPGPGTLTFFMGLGMIAGEFRPVARLLDWAEVRVRKLAR
jgi:Putative transmembrane protein (PGPGW)